MLRFSSILAALWLSATIALAAIGDILSTTIRPDGFSASIVVEGLSTGGTYSMGWTSRNTASSSVPKIMFSVTSDGYNRDGTTRRWTRAVPGTIQFRKPYPDHAQNQETAGGGNVTIVVALYEYVYPSCTATVTMLGGWYTQGGTPTNAVTAAAVTNSSTATYADDKVLASWSDVSFKRITDTTFELRCFAYHSSAQDGRPVRSVHFKVTDGTTTETLVVSTMTKSQKPGDPYAFPEYIGTFTSANFAQGSLTCNFKAFPWRGDSTTVYDTESFGAAPSYDSGPITLFNDKTGAYGSSMALVETTGNDATGVVYSAGSYNSATAAPFLTHAAAAAACRTYNSSNFGRGDVGASIIETGAGNYALFGPAGTFGTVPAVWLTIRPKTGVTASQVVFNTASGATDISDRVHLQQVSLTMSTSGFNGCNAVWVDRSIVNSTSTDLFDGTCLVWSTGTNYRGLSQGLRTVTGTQSAFPLARGCDFTGGFAHNIITPLAIGCQKLDNSVAGSLWFRDTSGAGPRPQSIIIAYCKMMGLAGIGVKFHDVESTLCSERGVALLNNIFENISGDVSHPLVQVSTTTLNRQPIKNVHFINNVFIGQRHIVAYNDSGTDSMNYHNWSMHGNIAFEYNIKNDTFSPGNANRIGNWSVYHGVNFSGNVHADAEGNDQFNNRFAGINTSQTNWGADTTYYKFTDYKASPIPGTVGAGQGDYHIATNSPAYQIAYKIPLPYDLEGDPRNLPDSAGAFSTYAGASPPVDPDDSPAPVTTNINANALNVGNLIIQ